MRLIRIFAVLLLLTGASFGQTQTSAPTNLPFFFPKGIIQTTDPILQRQEYYRYLVSTWACNQGNPNGMQELIAEPGSLAVQTDIASTSSVTENPAKMRIVLDHFIKQADGRIRVTTLCDQYFITPAQLNVVVEGLKTQVINASVKDDQFYSVIYGKAVAARAFKLGISKGDLEKQLDEKVPGYNVTFRELHRLPKTSKSSDFVPRELHLGYNIPLGGILGVTWLNTGIIYYNPDAWITDYLNGIPKVMQHEMVHANINVEKFPMSEAFDVELMASLPEALYQENETDLATHSYMGDVRELAEIYFNFDFKQMRQDVFGEDLAGNATINEANYRSYYKQMDVVKKEMLDFFQNVTIPEFYSDPVWWSAMNDVRGDNNSVFRMTMANSYNPTLLGGAKATNEWLEAHHEEIVEIYGRALKAGLEKSSGGMAMGMTVSPMMRDQYQRMFTERERGSIEQYFKQHPEKLNEIQKMSPVELMQFMSQFKSSTKGVTVQ